MSEMKWIPIIDKLPREGDYVLLSFSNFSVPVIGRFEDGAFYAGDEDETLSSKNMYVDAWMPLPVPYAYQEDPYIRILSRVSALPDADTDQLYSHKLIKSSCVMDIVREEMERYDNYNS